MKASNSEKLEFAFTDLQHAICGVFDVRHDSTLSARSKGVLQDLIDSLEIAARELETIKETIRINEVSK
jgi:hypothetical protein